MTMKKTAFILFLTATAIAPLSMPNVAQARPSLEDLTCKQAKSLVRSRGSVTLNTDGPHVYERFVANSSYCLAGQDAEGAREETSDSNSCFIGFQCFDPTDDD